MIFILLKVEKKTIYKYFMLKLEFKGNAQTKTNFTTKI